MLLLDFTILYLQKRWISPVLNEMVLENKVIDIFKIENEKYHTFYTPQKIKEYERLMSC